MVRSPLASQLLSSFLEGSESEGRVSLVPAALSVGCSWFQGRLFYWSGEAEGWSSSNTTAGPAQPLAVETCSICLLSKLGSTLGCEMQMCGIGNSCLRLGLQYHFAQWQVQNLSISIMGQSWQLPFLGEASKDASLRVTMLSKEQVQPNFPWLETCFQISKWETEAICSAVVFSFQQKITALFSMSFQPPLGRMAL